MSKTLPITRNTLDRLHTIAWGVRYFGSLTTNRQFPRRSMMRLVDRGLAQSAGFVVVCDDDGFIAEPERYREGFTLTDAGKAAIEAEATNE